jgi:hypothetical protein
VQGCWGRERGENGKKPPCRSAWLVPQTHTPRVVLSSAASGVTGEQGPLASVMKLEDVHGSAPMCELGRLCHAAATCWLAKDSAYPRNAVVAPIHGRF